MVEYEQRALPYMRLFEELEPLEKLEVCANHWSGRRHSWIREKYHLDPTVDIAHECAKWIEARDALASGKPHALQGWDESEQGIYTRGGNSMSRAGASRIHACGDRDLRNPSCGAGSESSRGGRKPTPFRGGWLTNGKATGDHNKIVAKVVGKYEYVGGGA
jgi:hypothetical protein